MRYVGKNILFRKLRCDIFYILFVILWRQALPLNLDLSQCNLTFDLEQRMSLSKLFFFLNYEQVSNCFKW